MAMHIVTTETTQEFIDCAVQWLTGSLLEAAENTDHQVTLALSGGKTPIPIYTKLATETSIPWERVLFLLADERYVPPTHPESNQKLIWETLLTREGSRAATLFPNTTLALPDAVATYADRLRGVRPDIVVLGMGDDGHIASLFPPLTPEASGPSTVIHTTTDEFPIHDRISTTLPFLLSASRRLFLITGPKKKALLDLMQQENEDMSLYPAQYLFDERTTWIVGP